MVSVNSHTANVRKRVGSKVRAKFLSVPETQIFNLHQKILSQRRIARELGIKCRRVSLYILRFSKCTISNIGTASGRQSACRGGEAAIGPKCSLGLSIQRVYKDLRELGIESSY